MNIHWTKAEAGISCRCHPMSNRPAQATLWVSKEAVTHLCEEGVRELAERTYSIQQPKPE